MTRHTVPPRRRKTIPGLKVCHTCGNIYTSHQAVCPRCHNMPGTWTRTVGFPQPSKDPTAGAQQPRWLEPKQKLDATAYPQWLRDFDAATKESEEKLSNLIKLSRGGIVQDTARALLAYRYREPIPDQVNLSAVEKEVHRWFVSHADTLAPNGAQL